MTNRETTADHSFWTALRLGCAASRRVSGESSSRWVRSKVRKLYLRLREERDDALMAEREEGAMFEQRTQELDAARARIADLELARDTARSRHIAALEEIERWKDASGLECGGDPDGVTPDGMRRFWEKVERERDEARSRISAAMAMAGGRWSEWGDRAVSVANILEGIREDDDG